MLDQISVILILKKFSTALKEEWTYPCVRPRWALVGWEIAAAWPEFLSLGVICSPPQCLQNTSSRNRNPLLLVLFLGFWHLSPCCCQLYFQRWKGPHSLLFLIYVIHVNSCWGGAKATCSEWPRNVLVLSIFLALSRFIARTHAGTSSQNAAIFSNRSKFTSVPCVTFLRPDPGARCGEGERAHWHVPDGCEETKPC